MTFDYPLLLLLGTGCLVAILLWMVFRQFSREARLGRRRRRNNARIETKVKRPLIRLSVRAGRKK